MKPNLTNPSQEEQLLMLKDMTARMGVLHEAQVLQMKLWPLVLFSHVKKCEEHVNFDRHEIDYCILQTKGKPPTDLQDRFNALVDWTKWLLGKHWVVRIKLRDKLLHRRGAELDVK